MGYIKPVGSTDTSSDLVIYSPSQMRQTAARILAEVSIASQQHDTTWRQLQDWLNHEVDPAWADVMRTCLDPYVQRLRASYGWLTDLAYALSVAADFVDQLDRQMGEHFQPASYR
ncbi:hypothetical protein [Thermogemmatispora carboxidivorans]|uniref:hypothetical protein n=1 Tax=Thermogemmatispora carboxidivorans TaxID=1382306 RepID=UPI00069BA29D|nr:hypothetical protein [Thermogemmatispora carboxidivorans]